MFWSRCTHSWHPGFSRSCIRWRCRLLGYRRYQLRPLSPLPRGWDFIPSCLTRCTVWSPLGALRLARWRSLRASFPLCSVLRCDLPPGTAFQPRRTKATPDPLGKVYCRAGWNSCENSISAGRKSFSLQGSDFLGLEIGALLTLIGFARARNCGPLFFSARNCVSGTLPFSELGSSIPRNSAWSARCSAIRPGRPGAVQFGLVARCAQFGLVAPGAVQFGLVAPGARNSAWWARPGPRRPLAGPGRRLNRPGRAWGAWHPFARLAGLLARVCNSLVVCPCQEANHAPARFTQC